MFSIVGRAEAAPTTCAGRRIQPKAIAFPSAGRPRVEALIEAEDHGGKLVYKIVAYDDQVAELETLLPGDSVAIQGRLEIETKDGCVGCLIAC